MPPKKRSRADGGTAASAATSGATPPPASAETAAAAVHASTSSDAPSVFCDEEATTVLVMDCGAAFVRAALIESRSLSSVAVVPNAVGVRPSAAGVSQRAGDSDGAPPRGAGGGPDVVVGAALLQLSSYHRLFLRRPMQKGLLVDAQLQRVVWVHLFEQLGIAQRLHVTHLVLTIVPGTPPMVAGLWDTMCFDFFGFASVTIVSTAFCAMCAMSMSQRAAAAAGGGASHEGLLLPFSPAPTSSDVRPAGDGTRVAVEGGDVAAVAAAAPPSPPPPPPALAGTALVIDIGFSHALVTPYVSFRPIRSAARRLEVGGKLLTNRLKELVSFTRLNVLDETWLMNAVKECLCGVAPHRNAVGGEAAQHYSGGGGGGADSGESSCSNSEIESDDDDDDESHRKGRARRAADGRHQKQQQQQEDRPWWREGVRFVLPTSSELPPMGFPVSDAAARRVRRRSWRDLVGTAPGGAQTLPLRHERVVVPEALFSPLDVGLGQCGLVELAANVASFAAQAVAQRSAPAPTAAGSDLAGDGVAHAIVRDALLCAPIVLGGCSNLRGCRLRIDAELQQYRFVANPHISPPCSLASPWLSDALDELAAACGGSGSSAAGEERSARRKQSTSAAVEALHGSFRQHRVDARGLPLTEATMREELIALLLPLIGAVALSCCAYSSATPPLPELRGLAAARCDRDAPSRAQRLLAAIESMW